MILIVVYQELRSLELLVSVIRCDTLVIEHLDRELWYKGWSTT